jgi:6-phosphofructokinase
MRIGILNSGGDCPGLNAVIHGVVGAAHTHGWEVVGFRDGFEGLLPPGDYMMLDPEKTVGIMKLGGTILGTTNKGHFVAKVGEGNVSQVPVEIVEKAKSTLRHLEMGAHRRRWRRQPHHRLAALSDGHSGHRRAENHRQ